MKIIRNRKGSVEATLTLIIKLVLTLVIIASAVLIFDNVALGDIKAQTAARNLGRAFDVLALTTKEASIEATCPKNVIFTISGAKIEAKVPSTFQEGFATYYYTKESEATLPSTTEIDCGTGASIDIRKTLDPVTLKPIITVA